MNSYLADIHPFSHLVDAHRELLERVMVVRKHQAGHVFLRQGTRATAANSSMWVLLSGEIHVVTERAGRQALDKRMTRGAMFGLVGFLDDGPRTASCSAATDVQVAELSRLSFQELFRSHAGACAAFQGLVARQLVDDVRDLDRRLGAALKAS